MTSDDQAIKLTGELIQNYATPVILAPRPSAGLEPFHHASGVLVEMGKRHFLVTALHVVKRHFERLEGAAPGLLVHLGEAQFKPKDRLVRADADADVAFLGVTQQEAEAVGSWIYRASSWPPAPPSVGEMIGVAGYPAVIRLRHGPKKWEFRGFATQTPLSSANDRQFSCAFTRNEWVEFGAPGGLEAKDLGGISGGPAFALGGIRPLLVGTVAEHGSDFDIVFLGRLDRTSNSDLGL